MSKIGITDSCLILTNEQQMCINIISCMVLLKIIKLKARRKLFLSYNHLTELFAHIFRKTVDGDIIPGQIVKDLARWRIIYILKIVSQYMKLNICKVLSSLQYRKYFPHMSLRGLFHRLMFTLYLFKSHLSLASYKWEIGKQCRPWRIIIFYWIIRVRHYMSLYKEQKWNINRFTLKL